MTRGLGVHRIYVESPLQRVHDEVTQALGHGRGVGVDDDQHSPLARGRRLELIEQARAGPVVRLNGGGHPKRLTPSEHGRYRPPFSR